MVLLWYITDNVYLGHIILPQNKSSKNTERKKAKLSELRSEKRALRKSLKSKGEKVNMLKLENQQMKQKVAELNAQIGELSRIDESKKNEHRTVSNSN